MSKILLWTASGVVVIAVLLGIAGFVVLPSLALAKYGRTLEVTPAPIEIPWPREDGNHALALEEAVERGKRYMHSRVGCSDCHGEDMAGGIIVDNPVFGAWVAPNITRGGVTSNYTPEDWVRIIRHGVKKDGRVASMPSIDFMNLSDQEISDIAAYIRSLPAVEKTMPPTTIGPMLAMGVLSGNIPIDADRIDHDAARPRMPPAIGPTRELGAHLASVCVGCHGLELNGGDGPDPSWPVVPNLTFHETGLKGWSLDDFRTALRTGVRPDGRKLHPAMPIALTKNYSDDEIKALYMHLSSLEPIPAG